MAGATKKVDAAAKERRASAKAQQRRAALLPKGRRSLYDYEQANFKVVHKGNGGVQRDVSGLTTAFSWDDSSSKLTGEIGMQKQIRDPFRLEQGDRLELRASRNGGSFRTQFGMRALEPTETIESGVITASLESELSILDRTKRDWKFAKTGAHRKGWLAHEIAAYALRECGVKSASLVRGRTRQKLTKRNASAMSVIVAAYAAERKATGNRYVIETRSGGVQIRTPKRGSTVAIYGPLCRSVTIIRRWPKGFATVLIARGRIGKKQVKLTVPNTKMRNRFGAITAKKSFGVTSSRSLLRRRALREIASRSMIEKEVTFTHPGDLSLHRGDQIKLEVPGYTFGQAMFVKALQHSVTSGDHEMSVTCTFTDPIPDTEAEKIKKKNSRDAKKKAAKKAATTAKARQRKAKS